MSFTWPISTEFIDDAFQLKAQNVIGQIDRRFFAEECDESTHNILIGNINKFVIETKI